MDLTCFSTCRGGPQGNGNPTIDLPEAKCSIRGRKDAGKSSGNGLSSNLYITQKQTDRHRQTQADTYICKHTCTHTHTCICTCTHSHMHTYRHAPTCTHMCTHIHMCTHAHSHMHMCMSDACMYKQHTTLH